MTDPEQVIEANLKFYFALESLDIDLMDEVWATDASACCVHLGWNRLAGWENIRANWEHIFRNTTFMRVDVTEVAVEVHGSVAWVSCLESITTAVGDQMRRARAYATNVFLYDDDRWLLVVHHSSLISGPS
jgi:ketosteroid isomerase-like protein